MNTSRLWPLALVATLAACTQAPAAVQAPAHGYHVLSTGTPGRTEARLHFHDKATLQALAHGGFDLFEDVDMAKGTVGATLGPDDAARLKALGVEVEPMARAARGGLPAGTTRQAQVQTILADLATQHPAIARTHVLGTTHDGRKILALEVCAKPGTGLPAVRIGSGQHARELPPVELTTRLARALVEGYGSDERMTKLVDHRDIWIVPVANPDGRARVEGGDAMWRKNTQGVDPNRNCDDHWEGGDAQPQADDYRGPAPFSEKESQALRDLATQQHFKLSLDLHNYAGMVLWPPGYDSSTTRDEARFAAIGRPLADALGYKAGTIATTIYETYGDLATWEYDTQGTLAFAAELDDHTFAPQADQVEADWQAWQPNFLYLIDAAGNPQATPPAAPAMPQPGPGLYQP